ncbi:MATE family efflux transporter [Marinomonas agarivorans]|nr:MATE family efflux transporter [Marinomonas agarivorans]
MTMMLPLFNVKLAQQLFSMTWPMVFGILSLLSFQLVDSAFIGQLGIEPLAAQGFTLPIQLLIIGLQVGLGIATTAIIARALGAKNETYAKQLAGLVVIIGSVGMALFCLCLWLLQGPILELLNAPPAIQTIIRSYWPYWLASAWLGALVYFYNSILRANGNTLLPGLIMTTTSLLNVALDPLFIFTFELGLNGAAIATILAFSVGIFISMPKVSANNWITFNFHNLTVLNSVKEIGHIMGPAMLSQLLPPVSAIFATKLIAGFGTAAVAAWALGSRYEIFVIVTVLALTMSMPPMIGRLLGAGKMAEIRQLVNIACAFVLIFQLVIALLSFGLADVFANLLTGDKQVAQTLKQLLMIVPFSLGPLGICMLMVSVANALGKSYTALTMSALRLFAFYLPCIGLGAYFTGELYGIFAGVLCANTLSGLVAWRVYQHSLRQIEQANSLNQDEKH